MDMTTHNTSDKKPEGKVIAFQVNTNREVTGIAQSDTNSKPGETFWYVVSDGEPVYFTEYFSVVEILSLHGVQPQKM